MKFSFFGWGVWVGCALSFAIYARGQSVDGGKAGPIPAADFFRATQFSEPSLNPSGTHLAAIIDDKNHPDHSIVLVYDIKSGQKRVINAWGDRDVYDPVWLDDTHLMLSQGDEKRYAEGMFVTDVTNKSHTYVVARMCVAYLVGVPLAKPMRPIVWVIRDGYNEGMDSGPMKIDANRPVVEERSGSGVMGASIPGGGEELKEVAVRSVYTYPEMPAGETRRLMVGPDGELAYAVMMTSKGSTFYHLEKDRWERSPIDLEAYHVVCPGDQPDEVWATPLVRGDKPPALVRLNVLTAAEVATVYQDSDYDCANIGVIRHPRTRKILGFRFERKAAATVWLDQSLEVLQKKIEQLFPGMVVSVLDLDETCSRFVVAAFSDLAPATYYLVDLGSSRVERIGSAAPWVDSSQMCPMQVIQYKARDGVQISGYLTLPKGASKQNPAPLLVLPHGGPWARDCWGWDSEAQFFASRGYAVFQPNYRGSLGTQWRVPETDIWHFEKMSYDVTDGVKRLITSGLVDPKRVAIMGSSFGGYLAISGAVDEPDLYRCAVTIAGVFDWELMLKTDKIDLDGSQLRYEHMRHGLGDPKADPERYATINPLMRLDRLKIPVFVGHGRSDVVVNFNQAKKLVAELEKRHLPYESFFKRGEGHGMIRQEDRIELYTAVEAFLAKHMAQK